MEKIIPLSLLCSWELEGYVSVTVSVTVAPMMLLYFPK